MQPSRRPSHFLDSLLGSAGLAHRKLGWTNSSINSSDRSSCFSHSCGRRRGRAGRVKGYLQKPTKKGACIRWMFCNTTQCPSRAHLLIALIATSCRVPNARQAEAAARFFAGRDGAVCAVPGQMCMSQPSTGSWAAGVLLPLTHGDVMETSSSLQQH